LASASIGTVSVIDDFGYLAFESAGRNTVAFGLEDRGHLYVDA
jgi:hypothetical protein